MDHIEELELLCNHRDEFPSLRAALSEYLTEIFEGSEETHETFLDLLETLNAADGAKIKHREQLTHFIWNFYAHWVDIHGNNSSNLDIYRFRAAEICATEKMRHFSEASEIFLFHNTRNAEIKALFVDILSKSLVNNDLKTVSHFFDSVGFDFIHPEELFDKNLLEKFSIYLIGKKKGPLLTKLLGAVSNTDLLLVVLRHLDDVVKEENDLDNSDSMQASRSVGYTIISKLLKDLNLSFNHCPTVRFIQLTEIGKTAVEATVGEYPEMDLHSFFEFVLSMHKIESRFLPFVLSQLQQLNQHWLANELLVAVERDDASFAKEIETSTSPNVYQLKLPFSSVQFVDSDTSCAIALQTIMSQPKFAFDSEWNAFEAPGKPTNLSIFQIALRDQVFIFDIDVLSSTLQREHKNTLFTLFTSNRLTSLAFAFQSDKLALKSSFPDIFTGHESFNVTDLQAFVANIWNTCKALGKQNVLLCKGGDVVTNIDDNPPPSSLSDLAKTFLGREVGKMFRLSNWSRRPLTKGQLTYAAIDAFCLIEIHDWLCELIKKYDLPLNHYGDLVMPVKNINPANFPKFKLHSSLQTLGYVLTNLNIDVKVCDENKLLDNETNSDRNVIIPFGSELNLGKDVIILPIVSLKEQVKFLCLRFKIGISEEDIDRLFPVMGILLPIQQLHKEASHLSPRGHICYEFLPNCDSSLYAPPFICCCHFSQPGSSIQVETKAFGPTKQEAKVTSALNMLIKLKSLSVISLAELN